MRVEDWQVYHTRDNIAFGHKYYNDLSDYRTCLIQMGYWEGFVVFKKILRYCVIRSRNRQYILETKRNFPNFW